MPKLSRVTAALPRFHRIPLALLACAALAACGSGDDEDNATPPTTPAPTSYQVRSVVFATQSVSPIQIAPNAVVFGLSDLHQVYDGTPRAVTVFFDDVRPAGATAQRRLPLSDVRDVLFVVDTVNAKPGTSGQIWIDDVKYGR